LAFGTEIATTAPDHQSLQSLFTDGAILPTPMGDLELKVGFALPAIGSKIGIDTSTLGANSIGQDSTDRIIQSLNLDP
jgi:hypothetical protein